MNKRTYRKCIPRLRENRASVYRACNEELIWRLISLVNSFLEIEHFCGACNELTWILICQVNYFLSIITLLCEFINGVNGLLSKLTRLGPKLNNTTLIESFWRGLVS